MDSQMTSAGPTDPAELRRDRKRQKRKARKVQWKERKKGRDALAASEMEEEKEDGDDLYDWPDRNTAVVQRQLPARLVVPGEASEAYKRMMAAITQTGGTMSVGTYRRMWMLIDADMDAAAERSGGKDWTAPFDAMPLVTVRLVVSDADLPYDECSEPDDDAIVVD